MECTITPPTHPVLEKFSLPSLIQGIENLAMSSSGIRFTSFASRCCFVDTFIGLWVPLVWPNNGSVTRSLPSLLTGFRGIGFPAFHRYYEGTKTSRVLPASSVAFAARYHLPRHSGASLPWLPEGTHHGPGTCSAGWSPPAIQGWRPRDLPTSGSPKLRVTIIRLRQRGAWHYSDG
jgi:hypothetical protein